MPYWEAPAYYGPWAGGYFSPFGVLLPGLLLGSAFGAGMYATDPYDGVYQSDDASVGDGGAAGDTSADW